MSSIALVLNDAEQQALHQLLDAALRNAGLNALQTVSHFMALISNAAESAIRGAVPANAAPATKPAPAPANNTTAAHAVPAQHPGVIGQITEVITGHSEPKASKPAVSAQAAATGAPLPAAPAPTNTAVPAPNVVHAAPAQHPSILAQIAETITGHAQPQVATPAVATATVAPAAPAQSTPASTVPAVKSS